MKLHSSAKNKKSLDLVRVPGIFFFSVRYSVDLDGLLSLALNVELETVEVESD